LFYWNKVSFFLNILLHFQLSAARAKAQQSKRDKGQDDGLPKEGEEVSVLGFHGGYF
jgi:hypothetical protein